MILTNCTIVTRNSQFTGTLTSENGLISSMDTGITSLPEAIDFDGDFLLPGLIELHTDNLEKNIQPRPGVIWPSMLAATLAHDNQLATSGITTVFDAVAVGGLRESSLRSRILCDAVAALQKGRKEDLFKADHFLHLRCEVPDEHMAEMLEKHGYHPEVRLISVMDHTPGQRQWSDLSKWRLYHRDKQWTTEQAEEICAERQHMQRIHADGNRRLAIEYAKLRNLPVASHDDTTTTDVADGADAGITISEFPTTIEAAETARQRGMATIMGAPNAIRGVSHSGNVSASLLAERGLLDGLSSDYVPNSLLHGAFHLKNTLEIPLWQTIAMVSANSADMVGLTDRGEIAVDKRADLLRVALVDGLPVVKRVWRSGEMVA